LAVLSSLEDTRRGSIFAMSGGGYGAGDADAPVADADVGCREATEGAADVAPGEDGGGAVASRGGAALVESLVSADEAEKAVPEADEFKLSVEFYDAYKAFTTMLQSNKAQPEQADLDKLRQKVKAIAYFVARLRLFSPNEELDDINTCDLKFLLVPYMLAEVTSQQTDMTERLQALRQSIIFWQAFAHDCSRLGIAHTEDSKAIDADPEARYDAATKRDEKIARYKRCKELDEKTAYLFEKKKKALGDELKWGGYNGNFDEDMERELVLALLGRAVASSAENIWSAQQEVPMLEMMMARGGPGAPPPKKAPPAEKPFIMKIQDKAELMKIYQEMVFQCPYQLPTMTLAEAADIEMADAQQRQQSQDERQWRTQYDEHQRYSGGDRYGRQEDEEDDKATYKARDWDDWKDEHPWGSGNKMANVS